MTLGTRHSLNQIASLRVFFQSNPGLPDPQLFLVSAPMPTNSSRRSAALILAVMAAALLHGGLLFWYVTRPAPLPLSAAAPLPMISMELPAPPSPVVNQPIAPPQPPKPIVPPKPDKPKVKPKPKPKPSERLVKQVEERKVADSEPAPPAPAAAAPQTLNHNALAAPRNDTYVPADSNAAYLNNPKPDYPMVARQRHWQGTVLLRVYVGADGKALQVNLQRSSNYETLDESALDAVKQWRFVPAKRGNTPEPCWVTVPIVFELD